MKTSVSPRKTMARKPSHFGSKRNGPESGSAPASLASIGSIGGESAKPSELVAGVSAIDRDRSGWGRSRLGGNGRPALLLRLGQLLEQRLGLLQRDASV